MDPLSEVSAEEAALLTVYREALYDWSAIRAVLPADSAEVIEATKHLRDIERRIEDFGRGLDRKRRFPLSKGR